MIRLRTPSGVRRRATITGVITNDERSELIRRANAAPKVHGHPTAVYHFSEDSTLRRFAPHVAPSNPSHPPAVWTIDAEHAPLYWFPRAVPRISVWAYDDEQQQVLTERFQTEAHRICAAEQVWLDEIRAARIYRYTFDAEQFQPWEEADGQYVSAEVVYPQEIEVIDDDGWYLKIEIHVNDGQAGIISCHPAEHDVVTLNGIVPRAGKRQR